MFSADIPLPRPPGGFIISSAVTCTTPLLAISHFDLGNYDDALFTRWQFSLPPHLHSAVKKRRAEYLASRLLVRTVLAQLGYDNFTLNNAPDRSPLWPEALSGSLSHSQDTVVLAVSTQSECIGMDVEHMMSAATAEETAEMLMSAQERRYLLSLPLDFSQAATLLFSLKESLYKAVWPVLHQPMDFLQAALTEVSLTSQTAVMELQSDFSPAFLRGSRLLAQFTLGAERVITLVRHPCQA